MANPFSEFFQKTAAATKIYTIPITPNEALKVLNLSNKEKIDPNEIMTVIINTLVICN